MLILIAVAALDVAARIAVDFNMVLVSAIEAMLFGAGAAALVGVADRDGTDVRARRTNLILAGFFGLAAIRSGLWAGFGNVALANLTVLVIAVLAGIGLWIRNRHQESRSAAADDGVA